MSVRTLFMRNRPGKAAAVRVIHQDRKGTSGMGGLFLSEPGKSLWFIESFPVAAIVLFFRDSSDQNLMLFHIVFQWNPRFRLDDIVKQNFRSGPGRLLFDDDFVGSRLVTVKYLD